MPGLAGQIPNYRGVKIVTGRVVATAADRQQPVTQSSREKQQPPPFLSIHKHFEYVR